MHGDFINACASTVSLVAFQIVGVVGIVRLTLPDPSDDPCFAVPVSLTRGRGRVFGT